MSRKPTIERSVLEVEWRALGAVTKFPDVVGVPFKPWFPSLPARAREGLYRFTIAQDWGRYIYVGQSKDLPRRIGTYQYVLPEGRDPQRPERVLSQELRLALEDGRPATLEIATRVFRVSRHEDRTEVSLKSRGPRLYAEATAHMEMVYDPPPDGETILLNRGFEGW